MALYFTHRCIDFPAWIDVVSQREHLTVIIFFDVLFAGLAIPLSLTKSRLCLWKKGQLFRNGKILELEPWEQTSTQIKGTIFHKFNIAVDEVINGTANYRLQDFELCLLYENIKGKTSFLVYLNLATEAKNQDYCLNFLVLDEVVTFSEEDFKLGQIITNIHPHKEVWCIPLCSCWACSAQLYYAYLWHMPRNFSPGQRSDRLS